VLQAARSDSVGELEGNKAGADAPVATCVVYHDTGQGAGKGQGSDVEGRGNGCDGSSANLGRNANPDLLRQILRRSGPAFRVPGLRKRRT
jgi:hypothetical protein